MEAVPDYNLPVMLSGGGLCGRPPIAQARFRGVTKNSPERGGGVVASSVFLNISIICLQFAIKLALLLQARNSLCNEPKFVFCLHGPFKLSPLMHTRGKETVATQSSLGRASAVTASSVGGVVGGVGWWWGWLLTEEEAVAPLWWRWCLLRWRLCTW